METPFNAEAEKKKNVRLALGVASLGVLGFFFIYMIIFGIMFLSPWRIFSLFPLPSLSEEVAGLHGKLLLFSKNVSFKGAGYETPPKEITTMRVYDGKSLSEPVEIKQFSSIYQTDTKIFFFDKGLYRTYDGAKWEEYKNSAIGNSPKGAVGNEGVWILSTIKNKPSLTLITDKAVNQIPLPDDEAEDNLSICCSQLLSVGNSLHLFWKKGVTVFWNEYDGKKWDKTQTFEGLGRFGAVNYKEKIYMVGSLRYGKDHFLTMRIYDNGKWSKPKSITVKETLFEKSTPVVFNDSLTIYQRSFLSNRYYLIGATGEKVEGPFSIRRRFLPDHHLWKFYAVILAFNIFFIFFIFIVSVLIRRFKLKKWKIDSEEYEFASLFRRYLALFIDTLIMTIPAGAGIYFSFKGDEFLDNPFKFTGFVLIFAISLIFGSFLYHSFLEGLWGKTIGKKLCGITVLSDDFTRCTLWKGFLRNLLRIIDGFFSYLVAAVTLAGTMKWQRLGDIAAGTVVVKYRQKNSTQF